MRKSGCPSPSTVQLTFLRVLTAAFLAVAYVITVPMRNLSDTVIEAVSSNPAPVCSGATCTITFTYTGDYYAWEVPAGTTSVTFDVRGASGGDGQYPGGNGGKVTGTLNVTGISSLFVYVGGQGGVSTTNGVAATGGWNGGANSGASSNTYVRGAGGGASDIRTVSGAWNDATSRASRKVVAGGGGGANRSGNSCCYAIGQGGAGGGTTGGTIDTSDGISGRGGTQAAGGAASGNGSAGSAGTGGTGGSGGTLFGGGGGGGGYYGGGGGNGDGGNSWSTGGGGGSSYPASTGGIYGSIVHTQGVNDGNGVVTLTYPNGPTATAAASISGTAAVGSTIDATHPTWVASGGSITVTSTKWQSSPDGTTWSDIAGATSLAYVPVVGDAGGYVRFVEAVTDANGSATSRSAASLQITTTPVWSSNNAAVGTVLVVGTPSTPFTFASGGYRVSYSVTTGTLPTGLTLNSSTGVLSGTPTAAGNFSVVVSATNDSGTVATSTITFLVSDVPSAPSAPTVAARNGAVLVSWTAPAANGQSITDYVIQTCTGGTCTTFTDGVSTATSALVTSLANGTSYTAKVRAVNVNGPGPFSAESATAVPDGTPPTVTVSASGSSSSTRTVTFLVSANEPIDCTTVTSADFTGTNVSSFDSVVQSTASTCTVAVTSSILPGGSGTTSLAASGSFSVSDTAGNAQTTLVVSGPGIVVTVASTTTTSSTSTTTTIAAPPSTTTTVARPATATTTASTVVTTKTTVASPRSTVGSVKTTVPVSKSTVPPATVPVTTAPGSGGTTPSLVATALSVLGERLDSAVSAGDATTAATVRAAIASVERAKGDTASVVSVIGSIGPDPRLPALDADASPVVRPGEVSGGTGPGSKRLKRSVSGSRVDVSDGAGLRVSLTARDASGRPLRVDSDGRVIVSNNMTFSVSGEGFDGGSMASAWMFSEPRGLGQVRIKDDGTFEASMPIAEGVEAGDHVVQLNGTTGGGSLRTVNIAVTVVDATAVGNDSPETTLVNGGHSPATAENGSNLLVRTALLVPFVMAGWWLLGRRRRRKKSI